MLKVTASGPNRLDIQLSGRLSAEDMSAAIDDLVNKSAGFANGQMLYEIVDFHLPSLGAIGVEFSRLPVLLSLMKRFDRAAVLTDKMWIQKVSELEGALFPGLDIKSFDSSQKAEAEQWLSGLNSAPE